MIPLATTTITVWRSPTDDGAEPFDPLDPPEDHEMVVAGVRAHISSPSGDEAVTSGGDREVVQFGLGCDPCDVEHGDVVVDDTTGEQYQVDWAHHRVGLGLDHVTGGLRQVSGVLAETGGS